MAPPPGFAPGMGAPGYPPMPPGGPLPPPMRFVPPANGSPAGFTPPNGAFPPFSPPPPHLLAGAPGTPGSLPPPAAALPSGAGTPGSTSVSDSNSNVVPSVGPLLTPVASQTNPVLKAGTVLVWEDANYSPVSRRQSRV